MTTLRNAAQQALEALEWHLARGAYGADIEGVTGNLRAALAQAEPVQHDEGVSSIAQRLRAKGYEAEDAGSAIENIKEAK